MSVHSAHSLVEVESEVAGQESSASRSEPRLCVHIGLPRTGTKLLQWNLFMQHPSVEYLGIHVGRRRSRLTPFASETMDALAFEMANGNLGRENLPKARALRDELLAAARATSRQPVLSYEGLSIELPAVRRRRAENLWRIFGRDVRALMVLRSPHALVRSAYGLQFRTANTRLEHGPRPWLLTIDEWFGEEREKQISGFLRYAETLQMYVDLFGRDAVEVLLFEDLVADRATFAGQVCAHFLLPPQTGTLLDARSANQSPKRWQHALVRGISRSRVLSGLFTGAPRRYRWWLTRPYAIGRPAEIELSKAVFDAITAETREGNRWIQAEFGVDLEARGYPV